MYLPNNYILSKLFMKRKELVNLVKINSHVNLMAEVICSELASYDMGIPCNFLKAIFTLLEVKTNKQRQEKHTTNTLPPQKKQTNNLPP